MWASEAEADHHSLEMCDISTMKAIHASGLLPWTKGGFNPITPSYLTVAVNEDKDLLTTQEALTLSAAFPYARGRRQEPLSERILTNDLYGIPLYQRQWDSSAQAKQPEPERQRRSSRTQEWTRSS